MELGSLIHVKVTDGDDEHQGPPDVLVRMLRTALRVVVSFLILQLLFVLTVFPLVMLLVLLFNQYMAVLVVVVVGALICAFPFIIYLGVVIYRKLSFLGGESATPS